MNDFGKSFQVYIGDLKRYPILSSSEEKKAFILIDSKEKELISLLFKHEFIQEELKEKLSLFRDLAENLDKNLQFFHKNGVPDIEEIFKFVKYSDEGREWLKWAYDLSQNSNRKIWADKLKALNDSISKDKNKFAAHNLRLVISIAKGTKKAGTVNSTPDMIQEGNIGLLKAIDRFDQTRGYKFSTYASWWIKHHIGRYLTEKERFIRVPVHLSDKLYQFSRTEQRHIMENKDSSVETIGKEIGVDLEKANLIKEILNSRMVSFDAPMKDDSDISHIENFHDDEAVSSYDKYVSSMNKEKIEKALLSLTKNECQIIKWRFGIGSNREMTLKEIGDSYNLSRERIRQIEVQALRKLRSGPLRDFK
jgi:RNA polymerase primary sigma factor